MLINQKDEKRRRYGEKYSNEVQSRKTKYMCEKKKIVRLPFIAKLKIGKIVDGLNDVENDQLKKCFTFDQGSKICKETDTRCERYAKCRN